MSLQYRKIRIRIPSVNPDGVADVLDDDWRFRLGLWVMKLGARLMRSKLEVTESHGPAAS